MKASADYFDAGSLTRVSADAGRLVGRRRGAVSSFKGIPYAAPPVGALRWRPPQRMRRWDGELPALEFGPAPIQELPPRSTLMYRLNHDEPRALVMSEDCLYLNVWSPSPLQGAGLPVLVWIHGGGNMSGHGGQDLFDGSNLAARGIVVVTVNMRLGALGFLSLPQLAAEDARGASGNYGVQDVVAALGWVQDNIASFGGDPARVTLAGNSAGAATVTHLMAAPAARPLFHAAIGQSASGIFRPERRMPTQREAGERNVKAAPLLDESIDRLRDLSATAFLRLPAQGVVVDGRLLTEDTLDVFLEGRQARIPLVAGWNADEGSLYASPAAADDLKYVPDSPAARSLLERAYPLGSGERGIAGARALVGDRRFAYPVWRWARTHAETSGAPAWLYEFDHSLPLPDDLPPPPDGGGAYGTFHTAELPYAWDNLAARPWAWSDVDRSIARQWADAWARFVIHGNPAGNGTPAWTPLGKTDETLLMVFGEAMQPGRARRREAFDLFDEIYIRGPQ